MFFLCGPTAVGKSELAVRIAERAGAEIISADAFQGYAGFDILTAKPGPDLLARVPHHLVGEIPPERRFDVAAFCELATRRAQEIRARGKRVLVAGGTGLYVRALANGLSKLPAADVELREELNAFAVE